MGVERGNSQALWKAPFWGRGTPEAVVCVSEDTRLAGRESLAQSLQNEVVTGSHGGPLGGPVAADPGAGEPSLVMAGPTVPSSPLHTLIGLTNVVIRVPSYLPTAKASGWRVRQHAHITAVASCPQTLAILFSGAHQSISRHTPVPAAGPHSHTADMTHTVEAQARTRVAPCAPKRLTLPPTVIPGRRQPLLEFLFLFK